jgi:integrase
MYARQHIIPAIGDVRLDALIPGHIDQLHTRMLRTVSATTTHHAHGVLSSALRYAARHGYRVSSAINDVPPPRRSSPLVETLTRDEVTRLINAAHEDALGAAYVLAVTVGMRQGELRGLRWSAVQLQERHLVVRGNATRTLDNQQVISLPKTRAGHRSLRLPEVAVDALMRTPHQGDLVWPGSGGDPMPASSFCTRWAAIRRRAGIRPVNFHALRHTAATLALEDGVSPHVVAAMLGHASIATTLGVYANVTRVSLDTLTDAINARYHVRVDLQSSAASQRHSMRVPMRVRMRVRNWILVPQQGKSSAEEGNRMPGVLEPSVNPVDRVLREGHSVPRAVRSRPLKWTLGRPPSPDGGIDFWWQRRLLKYRCERLS